MECNRHNFCTFWTMFCPFTPLLTPKIKIWKKCKKHLKWRSYDVPKIMIIYAILSLISLRLGYYFAIPPTPSFLPSFLIAQTSFKGLKMVKNNWKLSFHFLHFRKRWDTAVSDLTLQKADLKSICWIFQEFSIFHTLVLRPMKLEKFYSCF